MLSDTHGGIAQGLGQVLGEHVRYGNDGQLLNASLMDYTLPRADMIPPIETILVEVPSELGPYGAKGVSEPATIPTTPAILNAIYDAVGVRVTDTPATPERIFHLLRAQEAQAAS